MSRIVGLVMKNNLTDIFVMDRYVCGHSSGFSEQTFYEDEEAPDYTFYDYVYDNYAGKTTDDYSAYEIKYNMLFLYRDHEYECTKCKAKDKKVYCDAQPKPVGFEHVVKYHGLNAYYSDGTYNETIQNFNNINEHPEYQICCSTNTIGDVGIVVEGDVLFACNVDLNTALENGRRYFIKTDRKMEHIIYDAKDLKKNNYNINDELVMQNTRITAIWLTDTACDESIQAAFDLANKYNLEIIDVEQDF